MKKIISTLAALLLGSFLLLSCSNDTSTSPSSEPASVSGTWSLAASPYLINQDLVILSGDALVIQPGVQVVFQEGHRLTINGQLLAEGTENDSILFTSANPGTTWGGLRFVNAADSSILRFCTIEYCQAAGGLTAEDLNGGAVYCENSEVTLHHCTIEHSQAVGAGGGVYAAWNGSLEINKCTFSDCEAGSGGGISLADCDGAQIKYCTISQCISNAAEGTGGGGGIRCENSAALIERNIIYDNLATLRGAGFMAVNCSPELVHNTIVYNQNSVITDSSAAGAGVNAYMGCTIGGYNNLVYFNAASSSPECSGMVNFSYSCISTAWPGTGNITADPLFVDAQNFDFHLQANSPCINAGDPDSPFDPDGTIADIGAYYYTN